MWAPDKAAAAGLEADLPAILPGAASRRLSRKYAIGLAVAAVAVAVVALIHLPALLRRDEPRHEAQRETAAADSSSPAKNPSVPDLTPRERTLGDEQRPVASHLPRQQSDEQTQTPPRAVDHARMAANSVVPIAEKTAPVAAARGAERKQVAPAAHKRAGSASVKSEEPPF